MFEYFIVLWHTWQHWHSDNIVVTDLRIYGFNFKYIAMYDSILLCSIIFAQKLKVTNYMWLDLRKATFHEHNSKSHFYHHKIAIYTHELTIQTSIGPESYPGCFSHFKACPVADLGGGG